MGREEARPTLFTFQPWPHFVLKTSTTEVSRLLEGGASRERGLAGRQRGRLPCDVFHGPGHIPLGVGAVLEIERMAFTLSYSPRFLFVRLFLRQGLAESLSGPG